MDFSNFIYLIKMELVRQEQQLLVTLLLVALLVLLDVKNAWILSHVKNVLMVTIRMMLVFVINK